MPTKRKKTKVPGIEQEGPTRFIVRARWTDEKTGRRRKREGVASTFAEAVALQQRLLGREAEHGSVTRQRFAEYVERWSEDHARELAPSTRVRYSSELARIVSVLGEHFVDALDEGDVRAWRDEFAKTAAPSTVNSHHRTMRVVLEPLVRREVLRRNPARDVPTLREGRTKGKRGTALSVEQFANFIATTKRLGEEQVIAPDIARMILTLAWTGVRRGELLGLRWEDYQDRELHVRVALCNTTRSSKITKTDDPRLVPVAEPLREVLDQQRRWLVESQHPGLESGLCFPADPVHALAGMRRRGLDRPCWFRSGSVLDEPLRLIVARAQVPPISPHSFRRGYENLMREAGVSDFVRRSLAGWRTEDAQAIYAGVSKEERARAAGRMLSLVEGTAPEDGTLAGTPEEEAGGRASRK